MGANAMAALAEQYRRITLTAVVDDDYPEVRHNYESALATFIEKMRLNGRFQKGNRYRLRNAVEVNGERSDSAVAIGEHAFRAGFDAGKQDGPESGYSVDYYWSRYDPPEELKGI